jgi:hypothetical protein
MNSLARPAMYEIKIKGRLDARWSAWFDDMAMMEIDDCTILTGWVADQAALHGLLARIRDLGLPLVSVVQKEEGDV